MGKYIIIKDCTKQELKTILNDWLVMYIDGLRSKTIFEIAEINPNTFVLKVDKNISDGDFFYLVNYFTYPIDFNKNFEVEGYATVTRYKKLLNKKINVFVCKQQKEFDNVLITAEDNETYEFNFGGKFKKTNLENKYKTLNIDNLAIAYEQIIVDKKEFLEEAKRRENAKKERSTTKRFLILTVLISSLFLICKYLFYVPNEELVWFFSIMIAFWYQFDYRIFNDTKRTFICVLISLISIVLGISTQNNLTATVSSIPLSSIILMLSARKILGTKLDYLYSFHNKWDIPFLMALMLIAVLISAFIFNPILKIIL